MGWASIRLEEKSMPRAAVLVSVIMAITTLAMAVQAQIPDDGVTIYAVNVVKTTPFQKPFTGYGIYLGKGAVLTAFHVIGRW